MTTLFGPRERAGSSFATVGCGASENQPACTGLPGSETSIACSPPECHRATSSEPAAPALKTECGPFVSGLEARPFWLETSDRVRLYEVEAGDGRTAVVLAHQGQSNLCDTLDYAKTLLARGLRVLAFDFRGNGLSQRPSHNALALGRDLAAAVERAHADGAAHVFLIGASMGGAAAVQNGARLAVSGIVSLSGTRLWAGYGINKPGAHALSAPLLYIGSRDDSRAPLQEARTVFGQVGSRDKRIVLYPGALHGWQLVEETRPGPTNHALIEAWIKARS
jgi:alpha-beta hydrolase superfamily lysophospholipase